MLFSAANLAISLPSLAPENEAAQPWVFLPETFRTKSSFCSGPSCVFLFFLKSLVRIQYWNPSKSNAQLSGPVSSQHTSEASFHHQSHVNSKSQSCRNEQSILDHPPSTGSRTPKWYVSQLLRLHVLLAQ